MGISMYWESKWLQRNTAITVAVLLVVACFGLLDSVVTVIDKALVPITDIKEERMA